MGRDISVVCTHPLCENAAIRAIVDADNLAEIGGSTVRFALKAAKVHLFDPATGGRIRFDAQ
jgi:multiple sugar transport system ATP-binding protein